MHSDDTKARALALLMLGNSPRYVAREMGVPLTTVRRWRPEARAEICAALPDGLFAELRDLGRELGEVFPGLFQQNGPKKEKG
jgi:transposase-like protein